MNDYEKLVGSTQKDVTVLETGLYNQTDCYGLCRNGKIYIGETLNARRKKNILAKKYGRYQTSIGITLDQNCTENREQKSKAHNVALEQLVTLDDLIRCSEVGLNNHYSCAESLEIGVETLENVATYYRQKYDATYPYKGRIFGSRGYPVVVLNTGLI